MAMILLLFVANYTTFTAARSVLSTLQGYQETKYINQEGVYIANLDPYSSIDMGRINKSGTQAVYDYLNNNFDYAFYADGFMVSVPNTDDMEISLLVIITCFSIWNGLVSVRLMMKDFTINLLVGLSYSKLRKVFYGYWGILSFINLMVISVFTASNRYGCWLRKDTTFVTYGLFGLIGMDWLALLVVVLLDVVIGIVIVENMLRKIKKIPISLGVLQ